MRRLGLLVAVAAIGLPAAAFAQSMLGNAQDDQGTVVVPPAPPIVPSPPAAPVPDTPDQSQASPLQAAPLQAAPVQAAPVQAAPLPPSPMPAAPLPQVIQDTQAPGLVQTPVPPADADNGQNQAAPAAPPAAAGQTAPAAGQTPAGQPAMPDTADSTPPPIPDDWVQEKTAEIGILDKVGGGASTVTVPVGGQTVAGDLQISVLACVARPPNEVPDDAVFLDIQPTDDSGGAPIFRGWMIRSIPGATVVGNASETLRVVSCT